MNRMMKNALVTLSTSFTIYSGVSFGQNLTRLAILENCANCTVGYSLLQNSSTAAQEFSSGTRTYLFSDDSSIRFGVKVFASDRDTFAELPYPDYYVARTTDEIIQCLTENEAAKPINDRFWRDNFVVTDTIRYLDLLANDGNPQTSAPSNFNFRHSSVATPITGEIRAVSKPLSVGAFGEGPANAAWISTGVEASDGTLLVGTMVWSRDVVRAIATVCAAN